MKRRGIGMGFLAAVLTAIASSAQDRVVKYAAPEGLTIKMKNVHARGQGMERLLDEQILYFTADRHLRVFKKIYPVGKPVVSERFIATPYGNFIDDDEKQIRYYFGEHAVSPAEGVDIDVMHRFKGYVRDESVAGWNCAVIQKYCCGSSLREVFHAYELGNLYLKIIQHSNDGVYIQEATSVQVGPIDFKLLDYHPEWPVDFSRFEQYIEGEEQNNSSSVPRLKKELEDAKLRLRGQTRY